jgi:predicted short-subunit dehydrogenase-like oxidoreductase (DUF2520 family)
LKHAADGSIGIAGAGRVAQALGRLLFEAGEPVVCVASRDLRHARSAAGVIGSGLQASVYAEVPSGVPRWLLAVADRGLTEVAAVLSARGGVKVAIHTSGAGGPESLAPLRERGVACGTLHPLQTIVEGPEGAAALHGSAFAVSGDPEATAWAERIAVLAGGAVLRIPSESRFFYHAAAVMASNYVLALADAGQTLMELAGVERSAALRALAPLLRATVENAVTRGPVAALTGPIERGDLKTVETHLEALSGSPERIQTLYRAAGMQTLDMARRRGLDSGVALDLEKALLPRCGD